jgi:hypothetical protein
MVDISRALTSNNHVSKFAPDTRLPYVIEVTVTAAQMLAAKGSAIAAADVYDLVRIPTNTVVRGVWARKTAAFVGTSTDLSLNIGYTGGDVDVWVAAWDFDAAVLGTFGPRGVGLPLGALGAIDTSITGAQGLISMVIAAQTGTWTGGEITLYVECIDLGDTDNSRAGVVALGS